MKDKYSLGDKKREPDSTIPFWLSALHADADDGAGLLFEFDNTLCRQFARSFDKHCANMTFSHDHMQ